MERDWIISAAIKHLREVEAKYVSNGQIPFRDKDHAVNCIAANLKATPKAVEASMSDRMWAEIEAKLCMSGVQRWLQYSTFGTEQEAEPAIAEKNAEEQPTHTMTPLRERIANLEVLINELTNDKDAKERKRVSDGNYVDRSFEDLEKRTTLLEDSAIELLGWREAFLKELQEGATMLRIHGGKS